MALTVATNTGALMAQAAASSVNKEMEISMERLSTGKRINGASDDAAGVAIASRLTAEIKGTNQAIRNSMDAQAMIDTAEGAHDEIENILQRMRELAVQAANDTNDASDRTNLQAELTQLSTEIDRISETTTWAGQKLLNASGGAGQDGSFEFQLGSRSSSSDELTISIGSMSSATLGVGANNTSAGGAVLTELGTNSVQVTGAVKAGDVHSFSVNGVAGTYTVVAADISATTFTSQSNVATKIATAMNALAGQAGLTATATDNVVRVNQDVVAYTGINVSYSGGTISSSSTIDGKKLTLDFSGSTSFTHTGFSVTFSVNGVQIQVADAAFAATTKYAGSRPGAIEVLKDELANHAATLKGLTFSVYAGTNNDQIVIETIVADGTAGFLTGVSANPAAGASTLNLDSAANAQTALGLLDAAITTVNSQRAELGSYSNRLDSTVSNLTNISNNLAAGKGRIEDADFAAETTNLAKMQILQQASTAMLAQANASKQNVLSLLQG